MILYSVDEGIKRNSSLAYFIRQFGIIVKPGDPRAAD
jgi:hypothetical protein